MTYPTFNWWAGCLRRYESPLNAFLRFCELNRVSVRRVESILPIRPHQSIRSKHDDADRLAAVLGEPISTVQTMFLPCLSLNDCGSYSLNLSLKERSERDIRFCPECARFGYHSVFHEVAWLAKCPFHAVPLQVESSSYGRILDMRIGALRRVMRGYCTSWPLVSKGPVDDGNDDIAKRILDWADCTNATAARISKMDFFIFGLNTFYNCAQYFSRFGQLCEISPPSPVIKSYFKSVAGEWRQEYRGFGDFSERVVLKGINRASLSILFDFYVRTQVLSSSPPSFVGRFGGLLDRLRRQHATCGCNWFGVKSTSGEIAWRECALGDKRIRERCPYEIVFAELEERWGKWTEIYERRRANQEFGRLIAVSQNLRDFGFVQLASDRATNRAEYFDRLHDLLGNFTWVIDASILNMLNTATTWQIETEVAAVTAWLGRIDRANRPPLLNIPGECVRLQQHGVGLRLMRWVWRYPTPVSSQLFRNGADSAG